MGMFTFNIAVTRQFSDESEEVIALFKSDDEAWIFIEGLRALDEKNGFATLTGEQRTFEAEGIAVPYSKEDGGGYITILGINRGTVTYRLRLN